MGLARYGACIAGGLLALQLLPACPKTAGVDEVFMSLDPDGSRRRNVFYTDTKSISCIAKVAAGRRDVTFQVRLRAVQVYEAGGLVGGRVRTEVEHRALFEAAGLELTHVIPTPSPLCLLEGARRL